MIACMLCANILMWCTHIFAWIDDDGMRHIPLLDENMPILYYGPQQFFGSNETKRKKEKKEHTDTHIHIYIPDPNGREKNKDPFCRRPFSIVSSIEICTQFFWLKWQHNNSE